MALLVLCASNAWSQTWEPVTGADELRALFSDTVMTATLAGGATAEAHYKSDGSGVLKAWGGTFPRRWEVKGNDQWFIGFSVAPVVENVLASWFQEI